MTNTHSMTASLGFIVRAPWQKSRNQASPWNLVALCAVFCVLPIAIVVLGDSGAFRWRVDLALAGTILAVEIAALVFGAWLALASSLIEQNQPAMARLVPSHVRDLRVAMTVGWCVTVAAASPLLMSMQASPLAVVVGSGVLATVGTLVMRWNAGGLLVLVALMCNDSLQHSPQARAFWAQVQAVWTVAPGAIAASMLLACAALNLVVLQSGGAAHARNYDARQARAARMCQRRLGQSPVVADGLFARFTQMRLAPYRAWMRRVVARRGGSTMPRLMLALNPTSHWTTVIVNTSLMLLLACVVVTWVKLFAPPGMAAGMAFGWSTAAMFWFVGTTLQLPAQLRQRQREQALLALLPGVPRGPALSRALSLRLSGQFLLIWLTGVAVAGLGTWVGNRMIGFSLHGIGDQAFAIDLGTLAPFAFMLWRRWSRMRLPSASAGAWLFVVPMLLSAANWALLHYGIATRTQLAALFVAVLLAWCAWRWVRMGDEPTPFPVGRLEA